MISDVIYFAWGNLKNRGLRSWLTILGVFIGIAAVVSLISLGNGLRTAVVGQFGNLGTDKLTVTAAETGFGPPGSTAVKKLTDKDLETIRKVSGVDEAIPRYIRIVKTEYNKVAQFQFASNLPETQKEANIVYSVLNTGVEDGRLLKSDDRKKVLLGNDISGKNFDKTIKIGDSMTIQGESFQVIGRLKKASSFELNLILLLPEKDLKGILNIVDEIDIIAVQLRQNANPSEVAADIEKALRKERGEKVGEEDFSVQTPQQTLATVDTILNIINLIVTGIATISLLIGWIGIANTMYTSVLERTRDIGIMKSVGAKNSDVLLVFLMESGFLGLAGGITGAAFGLGAAYLVTFIVNSAFPGLSFSVMVSWPLLLGAIAFSFGIGLLSGLLPARQASKLNPVDALRR